MSARKGVRVRNSLRRGMGLAVVLTLVLVYVINRRTPSSAEPELAPAAPSSINFESDYVTPTRAPVTVSAAGSYQAFSGVEYPYSQRAFLETFDGEPARPSPWRASTDWDVAIHSRDIETWRQMLPMEALTGPNCEPAPSTHRVREYGDSVFQCDNRLLTAVNGGAYAVAYMTPAVLAQFSTNEAVTIRFDVSTERLSSRDWIDLWITPFEDHLLYPLEPWQPSLTGQPRNAIHVRMDASWNSTWIAEIIRDFEAERVERTDSGWQGYETFLTPSRDRETFELTMSQTHIRFGLPEYNFWWVDAEIDPPLPFMEGVVQFGHHSSSPLADCTDENGVNNCRPNTWEWDNIFIDPAQPFLMQPADARYVDATTERTVFFNQPAPRGAMLRFAAIGTNLDLSFDGGDSWISADLQAQSVLAEEKFKSYWMPIPWGTESVTFRGENWWGGPWHVRDISIWKR